MKKIEVFEGNRLLDDPVRYPTINPHCAFVGVDRDGEDMYVPLDDELLSRHLLLLGGIGTGKTNTFHQIIGQIREAMSDQDVMIVFDTKGDFYNRFYREGDIVISNDDTATGADGEDYWNVFAEIEDNEEAETSIGEIAKTLFEQRIKQTNQPFFPNAAKDLFAAILTHMTRHEEVHATNELLRWFLDGSPTADLRAMLEQHEDLRAMISYIADDDSSQTQGVMSELQQVMREIFIGHFKKEGSLSMRRIVREKGGKCVFIEYDLGIGQVLAPIYSLLCDLAIKEALCRRKSDGNVYFVIDEFSLLPSLRHVEDAVNFGRSLGVKFMIGIQNIDQMYAIYGEHRARSMLSGFLTTVCFRVNDEKSKAYVRELHGSNRKKDVYMASVQGRGIVENVREAHVVEDWDIARLSIGEAIIGFPGREPFLFRFKRV